MNGQPATREAVAATWQPILDGELGDRALETVREIVAGLPEPPVPSLEDASLAHGHAGLAVLGAYLALAGLDDGRNANAFLRQAARVVAARRMRVSLYGGLTGVAWVMAHLRGRLGSADGQDRTLAVDQTLLRYLERSPCPDGYDLISGLVGLGVYALERRPHPVGTHLLELVVHRLNELAERHANGVTWLTPPEALPHWQRALHPQGYYNLGVAHGVPGVIALLGQAYATGVARPEVASLLDGAVAWLLDQMSDAGSGSAFAAWTRPGIRPEPCRLAWCYGDAGVAAALLLAARCVGKPAWERTAIDIARRAAQRDGASAAVADAGLCHGAAGLAHIFNRIYQATGELSLGAASRFWYERTLEMRQPGSGIAGFSALTVDDRGRKQWMSTPSVLTGAAGIALALLAAVTTVEPAWDRVFLVSIPPHRQSTTQGGSSW